MHVRGSPVKGKTRVQCMAYPLRITTGVQIVAQAVARWELTPSSGEIQGLLCNASV